MLRKLFVAITACVMLSAYAYADTKLEADVVIIGAGGAGLSAALTASQGGGTVVLIEKNAAVGGSANFAEGIFGVESSLQRFRRIEYTKDEIFIDEMGHAQWGSNAPLVRRFQNESAKTIDWLIENGVPFEGPSNNFHVNNPTWHLIDGHGAKLVSVLSNKIRAEKNIKLLMETRGMSLIVEKGKVVGAVAEDADGEKYTIRAKGAVIICTGGFADNREMLDKYTNAKPDTYAVAPINKTGDGINMLLGLGAVTEDIGSLQYVVGKYNEPGKPRLNVGDWLDIAVLTLQPRNVWVNGFGERFASEGIGVDFSMHSNAVYRQLASWSIFDESLKNYYKEKGPDGGFGVIRRAAVPIPNLDEQWNSAAKTETTTMVKGNLNQIAKIMGIPAATLKKTLEDYNKNAEKNIDPEFAKEPRWLTPLNLNGTLYAVRMKEAMLTTVGGIRVNKMLQPLDENDKPFQGVFVAGNDVGGMYFNTYTLAKASGSTFGFAVNSGRMAAMQALENAGIKKK